MILFGNKQYVVLFMVAPFILNDHSMWKYYKGLSRYKRRLRFAPRNRVTPHLLSK
jgi:hypothetical protein